jgi:hypothetical protein
MEFKKFFYFFCSMMFISLLFFFNEAWANKCITDVTWHQMCIRLHNNSTQSLRVQNVPIDAALATTTQMPLNSGLQAKVQEGKSSKQNHGGYIFIVSSSGNACVIRFYRYYIGPPHFVTNVSYPENATLECKVTAGENNQFADIDIFDKEKT